MGGDDSMKCPNCGIIDNSKVWDSRNHKWTVRRRRRCKTCNHKFKTFEVHEEDFFRYQDRQTIGWGMNEDKIVIGLREQGVSSKEIGAKLGRSFQSVNMRIFRLIESQEYFDILSELEGLGYEVVLREKGVKP